MNTLLWMLRFHSISFVTGALFMAAGGYALFVYAPTVDDSAPWVPAPLAFGTLPLILALASGFWLVLSAWQHARRREQ